MVHQKKSNFIKRPQFSGGKDEFRKIIVENLVYPEEAKAKGIEGTVYLTITVNDYGEVVDAKVDKGVGYGCDEEAIRLAHLLKYDKVKNRGVRLTIQNKLKIEFKLQKHEVAFQYQYTTPTVNTPVKQEVKNEKPVTNYSYTISF